MFIHRSNGLSLTSGCTGFAACKLSERQWPTLWWMGRGAMPVRRQMQMWFRQITTCASNYHFFTVFPWRQLNKGHGIEIPQVTTGHGMDHRHKASHCQNFCLGNSLVTIFGDAASHKSLHTVQLERQESQESQDKTKCINLSMPRKSLAKKCKNVQWAM